MNIGKEIEVRRLSELLRILEKDVSERSIERVLATDLIAAKYSYEVMVRYLNRRAHVQKRFVEMCRDSHMVAAGAHETASICESAGCSQPLDKRCKFWYSLVSEQLRALCAEKDSFSAIMDGCDRAKRAMQEESPDVLYDYYDGDTFRRLHGDRMINWDRGKEIVVFLSLSSDGFEVNRGRDKAQTAWPVTTTILNLNQDHRFKASNVLIPCVIPGKHDPEYFETFLHNNIMDLRRLESGMDVRCADGIWRTLRAFVLFVTADSPAAAKLVGYLGHMASFPCRYCLKKAIYVQECGALYLLPSGTTPSRKNAISTPMDSSDFSWLECECPEPRGHEDLDTIWTTLSNLMAKTEHKSKGYVTKLQKSTRVKRKPLISVLLLENVQSVPYDPMHLVFLGWVKLLLILSTGKHKRHTNIKSPYIIPENVLLNINTFLSNGARGIPSS